MPETKLRFGVVGAGKIGTFHTRTLAKMKGVELVGVADANLMRSQKLAWEHNCTPYSKYDDLIPQIDALIVAVPTELHKQVALAAIDKGVHCLVEKPIASTLEQARELLDASKKKGVLLQVGHSERFNPAVVEAFKHVKNPRFINIQRLGPYDPRMSNIGVVLDLMIHDIDLLLTMLGSPVVSFEAVGASLLSPHEDIANVRMRFKNGCIADVTASRVSLERARFMRVYQEDCYMSVDFMNARVKLITRKTPVVKSLSDLDVAYPKLEKQLPITAEILHFIDCIHNMKKPWPSGEMGKDALSLALNITDELQRYEANRAQDPTPKGPIQVVSDIGKAAQVAITETLSNIGLDRS